jgi:hypothetical protein
VSRLLLATAALTLSLAAPVAAQDLGAFDATIVGVDKKNEIRSFPVTTPDGRTGRTDWRVALDTGNCCENYVMTTPDGTIIDYGGSYPTYTADDGQTWSQAQPLVPFISGEGAIVGAPNGDVVGVGWDPYSGDRLQAFKYEAATRKWRYKDIALHQPFYDREWIGVVPGPVTMPTGETVPYLTFIRGAYPNKDAYLMSTDGLTYVQTPGTQLPVAPPSDLQSLPVQPSPDFDWMQAHVESTFTPLGGGLALAGPSFLKSGYHVFNPDTLLWETYAPESGGPEGLVHTDSRGRLHDVVPQDSGFTYRISSDGGQTWESTKVALGGNITIENIDYKVNAKLGLAAVGLHTNDATVKSDRDLLYKLDVSGDTPKVIRRHEIGLADVNGSSGVAADIRFDFETVALLPDGRAVISFYDTKTNAQPAIAIEVSTSLPGEPVGSTGASGGGVGATAPQTTATPAPTPGASPVVKAPQKLKLTLQARRSGRKAKLTGRVAPATRGVTVFVERKKGARWVRVARTTTDAAGRFGVVRAVARRTQLRAVIRGSAERSGARSRVVRLR